MKNFLSYRDAAFLYLERRDQPINVAALGIFDGTIPLEPCVEFVRSRLPLIPRYLQHVVAPPFNLGLPSWKFDPEFNIRNHIREVTLERGTDADLKETAARVISKTLDRSRPLWEIALLRGLKGDRTGVVIRVHHCLADGASGVGLLNVLMDPSPVTPNLPKGGPLLKVPPRSGLVASLLGGLVSSCFSPIERLLAAESELLNIVQQIIGGDGKQQRREHGTASSLDGPQPTYGKAIRFMKELAAPTQRLPFNAVCHGPQQFHWAEIPISEMNAAKRDCGATLNDVALSVVTLAVRRYAESNGVQVAGRLLRVVVPVNLRADGDIRELGNQITFLPVTIPLDIDNPRDLVTAVHERITFLRRTCVAEMVSLAGTLLGIIPTAAQALLGPIASQLPISVCNTICTNVPGPRVPLYLLGRKMLSCYPYVATGGEMGMNCAILTYNGIAYFGFTADAQTMPDSECMGRFVRMSFRDLRRLLSARAARSGTKTPAASSGGTVLAIRKTADAQRPVAAHKIKGALA